MRAIVIFLALIVVGIAGYLVYARAGPAAGPSPVACRRSTEAAVRAIVAEMIAARETELTAKGPINTAEIDPAILNPMIEDYLMGDPRILQRMSDKLETEIRTAEAAAAKAAIATMQDAIFNDPDHIVIGNPDGDVTLVEMFDYNCGYCRGALPDLATLIAEDPNLKVILKEFPILSQGLGRCRPRRRPRLAAARRRLLGLPPGAVHRAAAQVTGETALDAAAGLGLNPVTLELDMQSEDVDGDHPEVLRHRQGAQRLRHPDLHHRRRDHPRRHRHRRAAPPHRQHARLRQPRDAAHGADRRAPAMMTAPASAGAACGSA